MRRIRLSNRGGDRATAYVMSNKVVWLPEGLLCTWLDSDRRNRWALVEHGSGEISRRGSLGNVCPDNHCGAALALGNGEVHAIVGGHHSPLQHYVLDLAAAEWRHVVTLDLHGTYPSLVGDAHGRLHLACRSPGERWTLDYCCFDRGRWGASRPLVVAEKRGYIYWTNGLTVAPEGGIHLLFGNTRVLADGGLYLGASHLVSPDGGESWGMPGREALPLPVSVRDMPMITGELAAERIHSPADQQRHDIPGPRNLNYQQILLSNPVVDRHGDVHGVLHNGLTGTAELYSLSGDRWMSRPLTTIALGDRPGRLHVQSSLSVTATDRLHLVLMVEPTDECIWGPLGTYIVRVVMRTDGTVLRAEPVVAPDPSCAQWLPALEHPVRGPLDHEPALLYTRGVNAGGFDNNTNDLATEVYLCPGDTGGGGR